MGRAHSGRQGPARARGLRREVGARRPALAPHGTATPAGAQTARTVLRPRHACLWGRQGAGSGEPSARHRELPSRASCPAQPPRSRRTLWQTSRRGLQPPSVPLPLGRLRARGALRSFGPSPAPGVPEMLERPSGGPWASARPGASVSLVLPGARVGPQDRLQILSGPRAPLPPRGLRGGRGACDRAAPGSAGARVWPEPTCVSTHVLARCRRGLPTRAPLRAWRAEVDGARDLRRGFACERGALARVWLRPVLRGTASTAPRFLCAVNKRCRPTRAVACHLMAFVLEASGVRGASAPTECAGRAGAARLFSEGSEVAPGDFRDGRIRRTRRKVEKQSRGWGWKRRGRW